MSERTVYHVTTADRAELCLADGLRPYATSQSSEESLCRDSQLDKTAPTHLKMAGVLRRRSNYAHVNLERALEYKNGGWHHKLACPLAVLAVKVTKPQAEAYVCDGFMNAEGYQDEEYWESCISLEAFAAQNGEPTFTVPHPTKPHLDKRYTYLWPEVLLPGHVPADRLSLVQPPDICQRTKNLLQSNL